VREREWVERSERRWRERERERAHVCVCVCVLVRERSRKACEMHTWTTKPCVSHQKVLSGAKRLHSIDPNIYTWLHKICLSHTLSYLHLLLVFLSIARFQLGQRADHRLITILTLPLCVRALLWPLDSPFVTLSFRVFPYAFLIWWCRPLARSCPSVFFGVMSET